MNHYFKNVPGLGNVAVSRHAQEQVTRDKISDIEFESALTKGSQAPDGMSAVSRTLGGVRVVVVLRPEPFRGACLVATVFRVREQGRARKS